MYGNPLIPDIPEDAIVNINYVVLKEGVDIDEVMEKAAYLCEHVKTTQTMAFTEGLFSSTLEEFP